MLVILAVTIGLVINFSIDKDYEYHGVVYQDPKPAPSINLPGTSGDFDLADQTGKVVLLFFGYTSCPDVCPSTLSDMKQVVSSLGENASEVQVVFITVDPSRDSLEKLSEYVTLFNEDFIGLTGELADLEAIYGAYGVIREIDDSSESFAGYLVNHTSRLYLIDTETRLFMTYGFGSDPGSISADIAHILKTASK